MQTIALIARKGGVGKTTSTVSLAGALASRGAPTLAIDFDPQASLTAALGVPGPIGGAAAMFGENYADPARLIVPTRFQNLSLLPGSAALDQFNAPTPAGGNLFALRDFLADVRGFERVLVDCPPNLYTLSLCALAGAQYVLTPTKADPDGAVSLGFVNAAVSQIQAGVNPGLIQLGYLLGAFQKRNALHGAYADLLRRQWPNQVLDAEIPNAAVFVEARAALTPVNFWKPRSAAAKAVGAVVDEIERRIARMSMKEAA